jgi:hypothetical protein
MIIHELQESVHGFADLAKTVQRIEVRTHTHPSVSLVAPILGNNFLAGIEDGSGQWWCIPQQRVIEWQSKISLGDEEQDSLPTMRIRDIDLAAFLAELTLPIRMQLDDRVETIAEVKAQWLVTLSNSPRQISLQQIQLVRLLELPDWQLAEQLS